MTGGGGGGDDGSWRGDRVEEEEAEAEAGRAWAEGFGDGR